MTDTALTPPPPDCRGPRCVYCLEPVLDTDEKPPMAIMDGISGRTVTLHSECSLRTVIGSVAHINGSCGCHVDGSTRGDPKGATARQAARMAVLAWHERARRNKGSSS